MTRWAVVSLLICCLCGCTTLSQAVPWAPTGLPELHEPPLTDSGD